MPTSQSTNDTIPCSFCILKQKCKTFGHRHNMLLPFLGEGNKLSLCMSQIFFIHLALVVTMVMMLT